MADTPPRQKFLEVTSRLLETQGYHATGLNQIVAESEAPKGSLYHYFPSGKEELAAEAVASVGRRMIEGTARQLKAYRDPAEAVRQFVLGIAKNVIGKNFCGGNPITLSALESSAQPTEFPLLSHAAGQVYSELVQVFAEHLRGAGVAESRVGSFATMIVASIEGGMILARTSRNAAPLEQIAEEVYAMVKQE